MRRPVEEVIDSLMKMHLASFVYNRDLLEKTMRYLDRVLDQIEREHPNVMSLKFEDLAEMETCKRVFEFCLEMPFDEAWWSAWAPINVQINSTALLRYRAMPSALRSIASKRSASQSFGACAKKA